MPPQPTPTELALLADGAMSVKQAVEFSGESRTELFALMASGQIEWFRRGVHRRIVRSSLVRYLAATYAADVRSRRVS